jgi:hypothetical protein
MPLPLKQLKAFAKKPKKKGRPEDEEEDEKEEDDDEASAAGGDSDDSGDEGDEDEGDEGADEDDDGEGEGEGEDEGDDQSAETFEISKLAADAPQIETIIEEIDADLDGEEVDEKGKAKVKGSLGRLPKGARKLIRQLKSKDFGEIEELVEGLADDGTIKDSGRFASWLYCAAQEA